MDNKIITVTSPLLPDLDEFNALLKEIWPLRISHIYDIIAKMCIFAHK